MDYLIYGATDRGQHREVNEDSHAYQHLSAGLIAVVADGVGGHPGGAFASALATDTVLQAIAQPSPTDSLPARLVSACAAANSSLRRAQQTHSGYEQMATTVVALLAHGAQAALLHAGDSRCYRWRQQRLSLLTRDHTVAEQMVADGTIAPSDIPRTPYQHILTRGLGLADAFEHQLIEFRLEPGDVYLLCSDGLSKPLSDAEIAAALAAQPPATAVNTLIETANQAGGPDNISVILIHCVEKKS